jgi:phosphoribosyl 1,2-cyclic phosphodiesterase
MMPFADMQVWTFASGSSGNCFLVESEGTRLLVECGRSLSSILAYLEWCETQPEHLDGVLLTHAHGDHARSAPLLAEQFGIPIFASLGTLGELGLRDPRLGRPVQAERPFVVGELEVRPFAVPHDCYEPLGFRFESASGRVCLTTDLGWVPASVLQHFRDVDLLVLESNYDPQLLAEGPYPGFLKRRVASNHGHLSNAAAAAAIATCGDRAPGTVWLAHISEHNNTPSHALETTRRTLRKHGLAHVPVKATRHRRPSLHWDSQTAPAAREHQLSLF